MSGLSESCSIFEQLRIDNEQIAMSHIDSSFSLLPILKTAFAAERALGGHGGNLLLDTGEWIFKLFVQIVSAISLANNSADQIFQGFEVSRVRSLQGFVVSHAAIQQAHVGTTEKLDALLHE